MLGWDAWPVTQLQAGARRTRVPSPLAWFRWNAWVGFTRGCARAVALALAHSFSCSRSCMLARSRYRTNTIVGRTG
jgi:hypothetical protein